MNAFIQNVSQDKELNRRIGLAAMNFGKLKGMFFTSKKVLLRVKMNVYSAIVLSRGEVGNCFGFIGSSAWSRRIMGLIQNPTV